MWIVVDDRERACGLADAIGDEWAMVNVRRLSVGDVAIGPRVLLERKTAGDLKTSLHDGRLFQQARALAAVAPRPMILVEGPATECWRDDGPNGFRGALLGLSAGFRVPVAFSQSIAESARLIGQLARQEARRLRRLPDATTPVLRPIKSPRATLRQLLTAIPGIGQERASIIARHIRSLADLSRMSEADLMTIPGIGHATARSIIQAVHT